MGGLSLSILLNSVLFIACVLANHNVFLHKRLSSQEIINMAWFILLMFLTGWWINWIKTYKAIYSLPFYIFFFFFFNSLLVSSLGCNKGKIDLAFWILYIGYGHIKHLSGHWRECRNWNQEIWVKFWINYLYSNHGQPERAKKSLLYCPKLAHLPDVWAQNWDFRDTVEVPRPLPHLLSAPHQQPMNECYWLHFHIWFSLCLFFPTSLLLLFQVTIILNLNLLIYLLVVLSILSMLCTAPF